jgi:hypothetical protein
MTDCFARLLKKETVISVIEKDLLSIVSLVVDVVEFGRVVHNCRMYAESCNQVRLIYLTAYLI